MPPAKHQTKFPRDIWLLIFDHFRHQAPPTDPNFLWASHRAEPPTDLLSLRLVCKTLKYWIDPLLFPVLYVKLESRSLRRFEVLSSIPSIARGVHGVCVDVGVYRASFGESADEFYIPLRKWMYEMEREWMRDRKEQEAINGADGGAQRGAGRVSEGEDDGKEKSEDKSEDEDGIREEEESSSEWSEDEDDSEDNSEADLRHSDCPVELAWWEVVSALDGYMMWTEAGRRDEMEMEPAEERICEMFDSCQEEYRCRCQDQQKIINNNTFVDNLAAGISQFGRPIKLALSDREPFSSQDFVSHDTALEFLEKDGIRRILLQTSPWSCQSYELSDQQKRLSDLECVPTHLLLDLPIACEQAGSPLGGLAIWCSPVVEEFASLLRIGYHERMADLVRACRNLRTLWINWRDTFHDVLLPFTQMDTAEIHGFLATASSGPQLEVLTLALGRALPQGFERVAVGLGDVIDRWSLLTLSELRMVSFSMSSQELEFVISQLSSKVKTFVIRGCELRSGTYAKAFSMLRKWVRETRRETRASPLVAVDWLQGGEFGGSQVARTKKMWKLVNKTMAYVESEDDLPNPLERYGL